MNQTTVVYDSGLDLTKLKACAEEFALVSALPMKGQLPFLQKEIFRLTSSSTSFIVCKTCFSRNRVSDCYVTGYSIE